MRQERGAGALVELIGVGQDDRVRAAQAAARFAQEAARENVAEAEGIRGVNHDDVEVAMQTAMLETIVEHQYVAAFANRATGAGDAVRIDHDGGFGAEPPQHFGFVALNAPVRLRWPATRTTTAIAARQNAHAAAALREA